MKSFFYSESWKRLFNIGHNYIYYVNNVPVLSHLFKNCRIANLNFTIIDNNYALIDQLLKNPCYKLRCDVQECPIELKDKLISEGFSLRKWGTYIIDLEKSEDELWNGIKKEARKIIRRTEEEGCTLTLCSSESELKEYYDLWKHSRKLLGFGTMSYHAVLRQWRIMHPHNYQVFLVRSKEGELVAGMGILYTKEYMREVAAARKHESKNHPIYPNDFLKWGIIKWGHNNGIRYYDLAGFNPGSVPGSKEDNIRKFKEKWGGRYHDWYFFEKNNDNGVVNRFIHRLEKIYVSRRKNRNE